jgi:chromosome segregation ATPase
VILVAALGAWGCAQGTTGHDATHAERLRQVEAKCAKLEDDYRSLSAACEQAKRRMAALAADNSRLEKELVSRTRELETARKEAEGRTSERDSLQARCDRLKKGIQALLGQDDAMLAAPVAPVTAAPTGPALAPS